MTLLSAYRALLLAYLVAILYLYPYGVPVAENVNVRPPDVLALGLLVLGFAAIMQQGEARADRLLFGVAGAFLLLELALPTIGALGFRRVTDAVGSLRMALLWLPMIFLTMLAPAPSAARFEETLARVLACTLWINVAYATLQLAASMGVVPRAALPTTWLEPWSVDRNFDPIQGIRPAGFFANSTALSVFGIVCLCFFYARYVALGTRKDLLYTLLAVVIVAFSTSRAAYATCAAILFAGWWLLRGDRKLLIAALGAVGIVSLLAVVQATIGIEVAFSRFQRLADVGLLADPSFGSRVYDIWPRALEAARDYRFGTLVQAPRALPLIDSGYLNYYLQGKWPFIGAVAVLGGGLWFAGLRSFFGPPSRRLGFLALFLAIYLTGALAISNPLRNPLMIFFIVYALWRVGIEQQGVRMRERPAVAAP
jgi:hypothetical protein